MLEAFFLLIAMLAGFLVPAMSEHRAAARVEPVREPELASAHEVA